MIAKSSPISSSRSLRRRGKRAVARSRVLFEGWPQNNSWLIRRRRRSATDIESTERVPPPTAFQPRTASSPPTLRSCSVNTGPYSTQCPSASMTGWVSRDLICAAVKWALTGAPPSGGSDPDGSAPPSRTQAEGERRSGSARQLVFDKCCPVVHEIDLQPPIDEIRHHPEA